MQHVAQCIHAAESIGALLADHPELRFVAEVDIAALVQSLKTNNETLGELWDLLGRNAFKGDPTSIANYGAVERAYRVIHEHKQDLESLLCVVGKLDVYMSCARLYKEFEHERVRYAFAQYKVDSHEPSVVFKDVWNPFIKPSQVVPNSIELGMSKGARTFVITGPNEGGK